MRVVVIGGTGLIGRSLVTKLNKRGIEAVPASPNTGVNTITGEGLASALTGTHAVVDVSNSPSFEDAAVLKFFETSTRNLLATAAATGVQHVLALSVVGADRLETSGYLRAKVAQEKLIRKFGLPFSILRATQFFEFAGGIAQSSTQGSVVRLPPAKFQPIASEEVAEALADLAVRTPLNGMVEVGGPEKIPMDDFVRAFLAATKDPRTVTSDPKAPYFGAVLDDTSLVPGGNARLAATKYLDWLQRQLQTA